MKKEVEKFRNGFFRASSRTYGEKFVEPIIRKYFGLEKSPGDENDALDTISNQFKEIKATKVLLETHKARKKTPLLEQILLESDNDVIDRMISFDDCFNSNYSSNIQNVKRDHFNQLIYVMLFKDCVKIFIVEKENVKNIPNWSDKHGRYDQPGKSGQFAITKSNIQWHIDNNLKHTLTWDGVYEIVKKYKDFK
jgi:hypothetical protein